MIKSLYPESVEESGQYLRLSLKNITDHKLPYNPISYLVWYDYATGRNESLHTEINQKLDKDSSIEYDTIIDLFKRYIADDQLLLSEKKAEGFQNILLEVVNHLNQSGNDIESHGDMLGQLVTQFSQAASDDAVSSLAQQIASEARSLTETSKGLSKQIDSTVSEIQMLREELEGIKQKAKRDMLTGLLNRRGLEEAMEKALAEQTAGTGKHLSVAVFDIDDFKKVNDTYGHLVGDNVLKMVGKLILENTKGKDIAGRFGGEEFVLVLPGTDIEGAFSLSEQIRKSLSQMTWKIKDSGTSIGRITVSSGITQFQTGDDGDALIDRADNALHGERAFEIE